MKNGQFFFFWLTTFFFQQKNIRFFLKKKICVIRVENIIHSNSVHTQWQKNIYIFFLLQDFLSLFSQIAGTHCIHNDDDDDDNYHYPPLSTKPLRPPQWYIQKDRYHCQIIFGVQLDSSFFYTFIYKNLIQNQNKKKNNEPYSIHLIAKHQQTYEAKQNKVDLKNSITKIHLYLFLVRINSVWSSKFHPKNFCY